MYVINSLHFQPKITGKVFFSLLVGSLVIGLMSLPQVTFAALSVENGKTIYQQKCIACHTIGGGNLVGPDLKGINAKRDKKWLARWIQEPDKMLAEGDSLALQLQQEYNNFPMPNFGLSNADANNVLAYIQVESGGSVPTETVVAESSSSGDMTHGKQVYMQKCAACHTIGSGRMVGPDLKGVTVNREESWLIRWIMEPNKMLAEGDAIATQQLQEYNNLPMPNLGVSDSEARDILAYIEAESSGNRPVETTVATAPKPSTTAQMAPVASPSPKASPSTQVASAGHFSGNSTNGKQVYQTKCAACHTIGGGRLAGPDLKGVTSQRDSAWLLRWLQVPNLMLAEGDATATQLLQEYNNIPMPNLGVSEEEAVDILTYIEAVTLKGNGSTQKVTQTISGDPVIGKALFVGQRGFTNAGPACIACHTTSDVIGLGGGTLGPDLTKVYTRYGGEMGLQPVLVGLPFPTMQGIFAEQPLNEEEAAHLRAYFAQTDSLAEKSSMDFTISMISIGGFIILYILTHIIWRNRLKGVRKPLVGR